MQILASALPGFRDLRAPLVAGYFWLAFVLMLVRPDITRRPTDEVAGVVYDVAKAAGPIALALAVGVAAYLVGSVSQAMSPLLSRAASAIWMRAANRINNQREYENGPIERHMREAHRKLSIPFPVPGVPPGAGLVPGHLARELETRAAAARRGVELELRLPATLLLGNDSDHLFSEADRLKSERDFRLAVVPPMTASAILLACHQSLWWLSALIPVLVLLGQGIRRDDEFRSLMWGAVQRDKVHLQSADELRNWVAGLPESAQRPVSGMVPWPRADAPGDSPPE